MLRQASRGRNIATNIAYKPALIQKLQKLNPNIVILKIEETETPEFWKHVPPGFDVFIDEAHLHWSSKNWNETRTKEFMSYVSQFRKDGDSLWMLAQEFGNLDKFLRQRCIECIRCRRLSVPRIIPYLGGRPIFFCVIPKAVRQGDIDKKSHGFPMLYTSDMCKHLYQYYETRAKIDTTLTAPRPTMETLMPTIAAAPNQPTPTAAPPPTININQTNAAPKRHPILKTIMYAGCIIIATTLYEKYAPKLKHKHTRGTHEITTHTIRRNHTRIYGTINNSVIIGTKKADTVMPLHTKVNGWEIMGYNYDGIVLRGPAGRLRERQWWTPPAPKKHHPKRQASPGIHL